MIALRYCMSLFGALVIIGHYDHSPKSLLFCVGVSVLCFAWALKEGK